MLHNSTNWESKTQLLWTAQKVSACGAWQFSICCGKPQCGKTTGSQPSQSAWSTTQQTSWKSARGPFSWGKNHHRTESPITPPQDTVSVQTGTLASAWVTLTKPNASGGWQNNSVGQTALTTGSDSYTNSSTTVSCTAKGGRELSCSKTGKVGAYKPTCTNRSQTWENPRPASGADAHLFNG